jgi:hypothetical protein
MPRTSSYPSNILQIVTRRWQLEHHPKNPQKQWHQFPVLLDAIRISALSPDYINASLITQS